MVEYSRRDPYLQSKYEQGVDAKIVIMGNTGSLVSPSDGLTRAAVGLTELIADTSHRCWQDQPVTQIYPG